MVPAAELHGLLVADRERTAELISSLSGSIASMVEAARLTTSDDEHDPEGSTIAFERSQASTYGVCERCGREIAPDRLRARPTARTCIACAAAVGSIRAR